MQMKGLERIYRVFDGNPTYISLKNPIFPPLSQNKATMALGLTRVGRAAGAQKKQ
jgi:hypothetical protein